MNLDIERAVRFPANHDEWVKTVAIGGLLILLGFLIVPALAAYGYVVRAIRSGIEDDAEPPVFDEWGDLIVDGVKVAVIGLIYQLPALIVFFVVIGGSFLSLIAGAGVGGRGGSAAAGLGIAGFLGGIAVYGLLALVGAYVGGAGVINFARTGAFGDGFDVDSIKGLVLSGDYLLAWGVVIALNIALGILLSVASLFTLGLANFLAPWPLFYLYVVSGFLLGRSYDASTAETADSTPSTAG